MFMRKLWSICRIVGLTRLLSDEAFVRIQYRAMTGKRLFLNPPGDFNEKIQWLKLHYRNPLMVTCADKWAVREFVRQRIGEKYLAECIGVYDDVQKIPFESLPSQFVLKATHGSGWNIICPDKSKIDWQLAKKRMIKWLKSDYARNGREWQYEEIKPQMLCEAFLSDSDGSALKDYKLLTFRGETKYIWVDYTEKDNIKQEHSFVQEIGYAKPKVSKGEVRCRNIYDRQWNLVDNACTLPTSKNPTAVKKPQCLDEMLDVAYKLARDFPQCRVDLYVIDDKRIVFGELTFSSDNGCSKNYTQWFNDELGSYVDLLKVKV